MDGIDANAWGRVILLSFGIFWFVELEKFLFPILAPRIKPLFASCSRKAGSSSHDRLTAAQDKDAAAAASAGASSEAKGPAHV